MRVGDYVKTKKGRIAKIIDKKDVSGGLHTKEIVFILANGNRLSTNSYKVIKSSPNIIDLIEVGDYVNGKKVVDKQYHYTDKDNYDMGEWCIFYENVALGDYQYDIKSIVTKEQFESIKYSLEG